MISLKLSTSLIRSGMKQAHKLSSEFEILDWLEKEKGKTDLELFIGLNGNWICQFDGGGLNGDEYGEGKTPQEAFENAVLKVLEGK